MKTPIALLLLLLPFTVSAQEFVIVVDEADPGTGGAYTRSATGGDCRPQLAIARSGATNAVLDWTTASVGYALETTNKISANSAAWAPITNVPAVVNSRYQVTNSVTSANQFYRLRKPMP